MSVGGSRLWPPPTPCSPFRCAAVFVDGREAVVEPQPNRRALGDEAEALVAETLERKGFTILARNVLARRGEVDVVASLGGVLCFVEVRMRSTARWGDPALTVSRAKQRRVVLAAMEYLQRHRLTGCAVRFDVASVVGRGADAHVELIPDAFEAW
ncbi:MAG: YraN family protein [Archangium sp.]|nr:YraN family protein [Archangium sp.]